MKAEGIDELCRKGLAAPTGLGGIRIDELELASHQVLLEIQLSALQVDRTLGIDDHFNPVEVIDGIVLADLVVKIDRITQARATAAFHA